MKTEKVQYIFDYITKFFENSKRIRVPDEVNRVYKIRIFEDNLDANGKNIGSDLYQTGKLKRATNVKPFGLTTLSYGVDIEEKRKLDIFSFSDREIGVIEEEIAKQIEDNINKINQK